MNETKVCKCGKEFETANFEYQCAACRKAAMERYMTSQKAEVNRTEKCDICGTETDLTVHFGMNEQTGKYAFHRCASCNARNEADRTAKLEEHTRNQNILNYIAETDN